jgi:hypothetical protein
MLAAPLGRALMNLASHAHAVTTLHYRERAPHHRHAEIIPRPVLSVYMRHAVWPLSSLTSLTIDPSWITN